MWNKKEMSQLDASLTRVPDAALNVVPLTLTFDPGFSRSNCISGMGGPIVIERNGRELIECPDVKPNHCDLEAENTITDRGELRCRRFRRLVQLPIEFLVTLNRNPRNFSKNGFDKFVCKTSPTFSRA